jgi:hypothetical protein
MNINPHIDVQTPTEPFKFLPLGVNPSLNGREAINWSPLQAFNRHEMPGKKGEVGPPASGWAYFTRPSFALRAQRGACPAGQAAAAAIGAVDD